MIACLQVPTNEDVIRHIALPTMNSQGYNRYASKIRLARGRKCDLVESRTSKVKSSEHNHELVGRSVKIVVRS